MYELHLYLFRAIYKTARPSWGKSEKHAISLIGFRVHAYAGVRKITSYVMFIIIYMNLCVVYEDTCILS